MKHFDEIYEIAADNYGLITTANARDLGIAKSELSRWVKNGRLVKCGRGVYKLAKYIPTELDVYAEAVALMGDGSFLVEDAVLAMHNLALVNPKKIRVGTQKRIRKTLPEWIDPVAAKDKTTTFYEGIPSQSIAEAILDCRGRVMKERLRVAAEDAREKGLITKAEYKLVEGELS